MKNSFHAELFHIAPLRRRKEHHFVFVVVGLRCRGVVFVASRNHVAICLVKDDDVEVMAAMHSIDEEDRPAMVLIPTRAQQEPSTPALGRLSDATIDSV